MNFKDKLYKALGERIATFREKAGLSQTQLADRCEISRGSVANIEVGKQYPPLLTLWRIGQALNVEPRQLIPTWAEVELSDVALPSTTDEKVAAFLKMMGPGVRTFIKEAQGESEGEGS